MKLSTYFCLMAGMFLLMSQTACAQQSGYSFEPSASQFNQSPPTRCYHTPAFNPPTMRIGFDPDQCLYFWYLHPPESPIVAHITVNDVVDKRKRKMRIDILRADGGTIAVRRYCEWDNRGAGKWKPLFLLSLPVYDQEKPAKFYGCNDSGESVLLPRRNAIKAILNKIQDARNEPRIVRQMVNNLRRQERRR
jgi:hypothetical protein